MRQLYKTLSVGRKITVIIMLTTSVAVALACVVITAYEGIRFRERSAQEFATIANVLAENGADALKHNDAAAARAILSGLRAEPNISLAGFYSEEGVPFATYRRDAD